MVGSIDPRCETIRGTHWPVKVAGVFGARVAENHLGQRSTDRINRPDIWMQAIRSDLEKLLRHGGRPHMGPVVRRDDDLVKLTHDSAAFKSKFKSAACSGSIDRFRPRIFRPNT